MTNPILVQATRGEMVENFYRGSYVVVDADGQVIAAAGETHRQIYARSTLKPIQALALIESGAAKEYHLCGEEIALACSSHNGEERHVSIVKNWLEKIDIPLSTLECGIHAPLSREAAANLVRQRDKPSAAHNACSGKHMGFLTVAKHLGHPLQGYVQKDHPTQYYISQIIGEVCQIDPNHSPCGVDGCKAPVLGMPLIALALGMAKLARPRKLRATLKKAAENVVAAIQTHPFLIAGTARFCTDVNEVSNGNVLAKMGADGVFSAIIPAEGWGIALKIDDGNMKAAEIAMLSLLEQLKLINTSGKLASYSNQPIKNWNKEIVGFYQGVRG